MLLHVQPIGLCTMVLIGPDEHGLEQCAPLPGAALSWDDRHPAQFDASLPRRPASTANPTRASPAGPECQHVGTVAAKRARPCSLRGRQSCTAAYYLAAKLLSCGLVPATRSSGAEDGFFGASLSAHSWSRPRWASIRHFQARRDNLLKTRRDTRSRSCQIVFTRQYNKNCRL